jgi:hypothetical protein
VYGVYEGPYRRLHPNFWCSSVALYLWYLHFLTCFGLDPLRPLILQAHGNIKERLYDPALLRFDSWTMGALLWVVVVMVFCKHGSLLPLHRLLHSIIAGFAKYLMEPFESIVS